MNYKHVDDKPEIISGYAYYNQDGVEEVVHLATDDDVIEINLDGNGTAGAVYVYKKDVPNLIKALQAAYNH